MALVLADRVRETTTVTGTGTATLLGAVSGYQSFSAVGNANTTYYVIANQSASEWEVGIGTYTSSGTTLSRTTVLSSSNGGSLVNFSAGTKDVFVDYPASKAVYEDASGNIDSYPITGGTINNTTVGATTPAAGTFTTLTGGKNLANYIQITGATTGNRPSVNALGSDTNIDLKLASQGIGALQIENTSGGTTFQIFGQTSNVNYGRFTSTSTTTSPLLQVLGADTNVDFRFRTQGTGAYQFDTGSNANTQLKLTHTASAVNYVQVTGAATGSGVVVSAQGSDTDIPLVVQPKGTGALQAQATTSSATGGNARGANAVDFQTLRSVNSMVASATGSVIVGGQNNTSSAYTAFLGAGANSYAQGSNSFVGAGNGNVVSSNGAYGAVVAGNSNTVRNLSGFIGSGASNTAGGYYNFIGAGFTNSGTSESAVTTQSATMNATTAVTLSGSNSNIKVGQYITGTSIAIDTYVAAISGTSLTLSKNASGSSTSTLSFYTPHGVVVGGGNNQATGSYSFIGGGGDAGSSAQRNTASGDYSVVVGGRNNVASGLASLVVGGGTTGDNNTNGNQATAAGAVVVGGTGGRATGTYAVVLGGQSNTASGGYSTIGVGQYGTSRSVEGYFAFASNLPLGYTVGAAQGGVLILGKQTTDATPTVLVCNQGSPTTNNQIILPNNSAYTFRGEIVSCVTGGGNSKSWTIEGLIKRGANAAATTLVGSTVTSMFADVGAATWTIGLTADTTNGGLAVTFTGQASTTIRTVCQIRTTEVTY